MLRIILANRLPSLLLIGIIYLGAKIVLFTSNHAMTYQEAYWLAIGEKLGEHLLAYHEVDTSLSPLSAFFYYLIDIIFGKSRLVHLLIASILTLVQGIIFMSLIRNNKLISTDNYLPLFLYLLFSLLHIEFSVLSPELMGMTFMMLFLSHLINSLERDANDPLIFGIGFWFGVATLFYFPFILLLIPVLITMVFLSGKSVLKFLRLGFGSIFPAILIGTYYYLLDDFQSYLNHIGFRVLFRENSVRLLSIPRNFVYIIIPAFLFIGGFFTWYTKERSRVVSIKKIYRTFSVFFIFSIFTTILDPIKSFGRFYILIPFFALFCSFYFSSRSKRIMIKELVFSISVTLVILFGTFFNNDFFIRKQWFAHGGLFLKPTYNFENKKILILGEEREALIHNQIATRYADWQISGRCFINISSPEQAHKLYMELSSDLPDVIIDQNGLMKEVFERIPQLKLLFVNKNGIYFSKIN